MSKKYNYSYVDEDGIPIEEPIEEPIENNVKSYSINSKSVNNSVNNSLQSYPISKQKIELSATVNNLPEDSVESEYSEEPINSVESIKEEPEEPEDKSLNDEISITDPLKTENIKIPNPERLINSNRVEQQTRKTNRFKLQEKEQQDLSELIKNEGLDPIFNYGGKDHPDLTLMGNNEIQGKVNFVLCNRPDIHDKTKWYIHLYFFELSHPTIKKEIVHFFLKLTDSTRSIKKSFENQLYNDFEKELENEMQNELESERSPKSFNSLELLESPESLISLRIPKKSKTRRYIPHKRSTYKRNIKRSTYKRSTRGRKRTSKPFRGRFKYTYKRSKGPRKYKKRHTSKRYTPKRTY